MRENDDQLSQADGDAIDALEAAGGDHSLLDAETSARARRAQLILDAVGGASGAAAEIDYETLEAVTLLRIAAASRQAEPEAELCAADADAIDALVQRGFEAGRVPSALAERAAQVDALGDAIASGVDVPASEDLAARTLAAIQADVDRSEQSMSVGRGRSWRFMDFVSVAATLLIAASVVWPAVTEVRGRGQMMACASGLGQVGRAFGGYAGDHREVLPMAAAGFGGGSWWNVGSGPGRSNSANLFTLAKAEYAGVDSLACAGNPFAVDSKDETTGEDWRSIEQVSYSYRVLPGATRLAEGKPDRFVILADRSPVVLLSLRGRAVSPTEHSPNHGSRGENLLTGDGTVHTLKTPVFHGDNIWLPRPVENAIAQVEAAIRGDRPIIEGRELPAGADDAFVGP